MERIVCLTEETTEFLYLLGEEKRIVGISAYTVRPPQAKKEKPKVSAFLHGNVKKIVSLKPDLIIGFSDIQANLAKELISLGQNVLIFNQRSIAEIFQNLLVLGRLVSREKEAEQWINSWEKQIESWKKEAKALVQKPRVFFQEWHDPIITGITWVSEALEISGGIDIFPELQTKSLAKDRIVSAVEIAERNPDLIIGSWCGKPMDWDWVRKKPEWQSTEAIRKDNIFEVDPSIILQPGPALFLEGIPKLREIILSSSNVT